MQFEVYLSGPDRVGLLADITQAVGASGCNIVWCSLAVIDDHASVIMVVSHEASQPAGRLEGQLAERCANYRPVVRPLSREIHPHRAPSDGETIEIAARAAADGPHLLHALCVHLQDVGINVVHLDARRLEQSAGVHVDITAAPGFDDGRLGQLLTEWNAADPGLQLVPVTADGSLFRRVGPI